DLHADTHVITQVDELGDAPGETVGAALAGTVDANALGADRQAHRLAHGADVDRRGTDFLATRQTHHALVAIAADQLARKAVVLTDELGDEGVVRRFVEFAWRGDLLDLALMEYGHAVGHGQRLALVVGHVHHRHAQALVQVLDLHLHVLAQLLVQRTEGFVHQHQLRFEHQRSGQRHTLLLTTGELAWIAIAEAVELHHGQGAFDPLADVGARHAAYAQGERQVLGHGHVREQRVVLEHHAYVALVRRQFVQGATIEQNLAGGRSFEPGQHHQAGGLAGPGRAEQGQELALADIQVEILDDQRLAVIALLHTAEAHQYIVCHHTTPLFLSQADDSRVGRRERVKKSGRMTGCYQARGESSVGIALQIPSDCIGYRRRPMGNPWVGWTSLFMSSNAGGTAIATVDERSVIHL